MSDYNGVSTAPPECWHFRKGTHDREIWRCVVESDEYRMADRKFLPTDIVADIGAHIGSFSYWAWQFGARRIEAYEPCRANFWLAERNLAMAGCDIAVQRCAVDGASSKCRYSDYSSWTDTGYPTYQPSIDPGNTGGGCVVYTREATIGYDVSVVSFSSHVPIRLLKLDCEGSEYGIILGLSTVEIRNIHEIVGEYHDRLPNHNHHHDEIERKLKDSGFEVEIVEEMDGYGKFFATRLD